MFCSNCGYELNNQIKFCPSCGQKNSFYGSQTVNDQKQASQSKVLKLIQKYFYNDYSFGEQLLVANRNGDASVISAFYEILERKTNGETCHLAFNYMNKSFEKGFAITDTKFVFWYNSFEITTVRLKDIKSVKADRAVLAETMRIITFSGAMSDHIYLTGIHNAISFVDRFNDFILELNYDETRSEKENIVVPETDMQTSLKRINSMLEKSCRTFLGEYTYCYIDTPITPAYKKYQNAITNFEIPTDEKIYIIYDETMFGNCKFGFAVTEWGIYYKQKFEKNFITWESLLNQKISVGLFTFNIGNLIFASDGKSGKTLLAIFEKLKELFMTISDEELEALFESLYE